MYLNILNEELVSAMGCTEPIAIAFAAAKAKEVLGRFPSTCVAECSGNIIKNVKSVTIPGTGGQVGIEAAILAGLVAGRPELKMEVLSGMCAEDAVKVCSLMKSGICEVKALTSDAALHIKLWVAEGADSALVEIKYSHVNIISMARNGQTIYVNDSGDGSMYLGTFTDRSVLNVDDIHAFAAEIELDLVRELLKRQIDYNMAIADEGLTGGYGVSIGKVLLEGDPHPVISNTMKAYTAAASEARMSGSAMPVVTNSGSGNQGIAASVPVVVYARHVKSGVDALYRALIISNLLTIHQKTLIGRLSAFCGVVCASCASGAAITYLAGGSLEQIKMTIANTLANTAGIICDGAKPSCAAKIASSLDGAYMAHQLAMSHHCYNAGDGLLKLGIEDTITAIGRVARDGMKGTEEYILSVMLEC